MTEQQWTWASSPDGLLNFIQQRVSERKLRLFACACFWRISHVLTDERSLKSGDVAERVADGLASDDELATARANAWEAAQEVLQHRVAVVSTEERCIAWAMRASIEVLSPVVPNSTVEAVVKAGLEMANHDPSLAAETAGARTLVHLLHEIFGNPFRSVSRPDNLSPLVLTLSQSLYLGEDCAFALHDALLDAGHSELAEHFGEPFHPKGCWVLDLLLGKS